MTRLTASTAARVALEWRKLEERASLVRGRVEALPGAYQDGPMRAAENRISLRQMEKAREHLDAIDNALDAYQQSQVASEMAKAGEEQARLLAERGIDTFDAGAVKARDGWQWIITRKPPRLSADQVNAGNDYARLYALAMQDSLSVSSNDNRGTARLLDELVLPAHVAIGIDNRSRMDRIHRHITEATGSTRLIALLDAICGRGETLRQLGKDDERKISAIEAELRVALDLASVGLKIMRLEERNRAA
jgi:hypothetical protein